MSYSKTLLAGAALCALCVAPALAAAPNIHLTNSGFDSRGKITARHTKTNVGNPNTTDVTETFSFSAALSESADYKQALQFNEYSWTNNSTCIAPTRQGLKIPKPHKTSVHKLAVGSSTGTTTKCPTTTYTFYGPIYELLSKTATSDFFTSALVAKRYSGYNLTLNELWNINIGA